MKAFQKSITLVVLSIAGVSGIAFMNWSAALTIVLAGGLVIQAWS